MHQLSRLLLSGLVALSLTFAAVPAHASWSVSIQNVMDLVYCLVGSGDCTGLQPGADLVDITMDNQASYDDGFTAGAASVDITSNDAEVAAAVDITSNDAEVIAAAMPACDWETELWSGTGDGVCVCAVDSAVRDCADVCGGDDTSCEGCDGVQNSGLVDDECGVCDGPGATYECGCADIAEGACDCAGNVLDCNDVCGGALVVDECGVCGGDGSSCACYSTYFLDYYFADMCFESEECCAGAGGVAQPPACFRPPVGLSGPLAVPMCQ